MNRWRKPRKSSSHRPHKEPLMPRSSRRAVTPSPHGDSTRCVHAGSSLATSAAVAPPIYQTATFRLPSAKVGAQYSDSTAPAELYTRWGNPTLKQLEAAL